MDNNRRVALDLIKDTLAFIERHKDPVYADADDCDYYRKLFKKPAAQPPPIKPIYVPPPQPIIQAAPARVEPVRVEAVKVYAKPTPQPVKVVEEPKVIPVKPREFTSEWASIFAKIAPELAILKDVPSDALAKKINTRWKTKNQTAPITLLYLQEIPEQKTLLEGIAKALDVYFGPAKLISAEAIEREKQWESLLGMEELKLIICCDFTLWQLGGLMKFYKEIPAMKQELPPYCGLPGNEVISTQRVSVINRQLGDKPLFLLPDLSLYLKDPLLKRSLWKALCQIQK
jgi:hypothetical protein